MTEIPDTPEELELEAAREHVAEIMFDSLAEPEPDCLLCRAASRLKLWQEYGADDPFDPDSSTPGATS